MAVLVKCRDVTEGSRNKVNTVLVNAIASVTELNPKPIFLFNILYIGCFQSRSSQVQKQHV